MLAKVFLDIFGETDEPVYSILKLVFYSIGQIINKSNLLCHVVKHYIMEKLINKYICFCENFPNHHIDK